MRVKALSRKRELIILMVDLSKSEEALLAIKKLYKSNNKYWIFLSNIKMGGTSKVDIFLQKIIEELNRLPLNTSFRIFLVGSSR